MANRNSALLLKIFILLAKLKKPLLRKLANLRRMKKLKLLEQYSYYGYAREYEFSPSSTPLVEFRRMSRLDLKKIYADLVAICRNLLGRRRKEIVYRLEIGSDSLICGEESGAVVEVSNSLICGEEAGAAVEALKSISEEEEEEDCVDERAERFIRSFYEEIRRQRNESSFQLLLQN